MIYKHDILVLKKVVDEISCKCVQNFWNNVEQPYACIFEDICKWCQLKFLSVVEKYDSVERNSLDSMINYAYNYQWIYGEDYLDAEDFNLQDKRGCFERIMKDKPSDLQIFQTILYILSTEHSAFRVKEKIDDFLSFDI